MMFAFCEEDRPENASDEIEDMNGAFAFGAEAGPAGAPSAGPEESDALAYMKSLAREAVDHLRQMMEDPDVSPTVKVKICEMILDRTYGKSGSSLKVTSVSETVEESLDYILSLVEQAREADE